jgi:hypothetical protein
MKLAILFWFYKEFDTCAERLDLLRRLNPETPIYGLYGGALEAADAVRARLGDRLDDFYAFPEARDAHWKWLNGDRLIASWMRARGAELAWDTVVVVQWDMLVLAPVHALFGPLQPGEALLSGYRPLSEVADWWGWAGGRDPEKAAMLEAFRARLRSDWGVDGPLWCCLFIVICLPRDLLARYVGSGPPAEGFLEYKLPTLAHHWGFPVRRDLGFDPWWAADPATREAPERLRTLNAVGREAPLEIVRSELADPGGLRVFHPFSGPLPTDLGAIALRSSGPSPPDRE